MAASDFIQVGDTVTVHISDGYGRLENLGDAKCRVLYIPQGPGDSWQLKGPSGKLYVVQNFQFMEREAKYDRNGE